MQHVSQAANAVVDQARDKRYPLTGAIAEYEVRTVAKDGSSYVVLTLNRGQGKRPVKAVAFDDKFDQVMDLIEQGTRPVRLFGFYENREYPNPETGEILTSHRFRVLWAGVPRDENREQDEGRPQQRSNGQRQGNGQRAEGNRTNGGQQRQQGQQRQGNGNGQRQQSSGQQRQSNGGGRQSNRSQSQQRQGNDGWWPN